jgi:hypothetical protein
MVAPRPAKVKTNYPQQEEKQMSKKKPRLSQPAQPLPPQQQQSPPPLDQPRVPAPPDEKRKVPLQEHPLFAARWNYLKTQDRTLLFSLLKNGNQFVLNQVCQAVRHALAEYRKLMREGQVTREQAEEAVLQLVSPPPDDIPKLPEIQESRVDNLAADFEKWLPTAAPQFMS